jgi:DNA modification methylase
MAKKPVSPPSPKSPTASAEPPSIATVKAWVKQSDDADRRGIVAKILIGQQLILNLGKHGYREQIGLSERKAIRCRAFARAWEKHLAEFPDAKLRASGIPVEWVEDLDLADIEALGAQNPDTGPKATASPRDALRSPGSVVDAALDGLDLVPSTTLPAGLNPAPAAPMTHIVPVPTTTEGSRYVLDYGTDVLEGLRKLAAESVDCVVTSPPYFRVRDYGVEGQGGREATPEEHLAWLASVFREVHRVLKPRGTCWVNYADVLAGRAGVPGEYLRWGPNEGRLDTREMGTPDGGFLGLTNRFATEMQAAGWMLRNTVIRVKQHARLRWAWCHRLDLCWEPIYCFVKRWDAYMTRDRALQRLGDVWADLPFPGQEKEGIDPRKSHPATFAAALAERCILLGCPDGGTVLDPFSGSGSTGVAATRNGRRYHGIDLNQQYLGVAECRLARVVQGALDPEVDEDPELADVPEAAK